MLPQVEADALLRVPKHRVDDRHWLLPSTGGGLTIPLRSENGKESFLLDVARGRYRLTKLKFQTRAKTNIVLVRIDIGGMRHTNPDGERIPAPHIHLYREGFGDRWAHPLPLDQFPDPEDHWKTLQSFFDYCQITQAPYFEKGLFA